VKVAVVLSAPSVPLPSPLSDALEKFLPAVSRLSIRKSTSIAAGLLIRLPDGTCNIHPSAAGHRLLAAAIANAIGA
jgi:lysophospholipase L1-like esterase